MEHEIIYIDDYALIVSDEQTKENDWGYFRFQGGDVKLIDKLKVIGHRPLKDAPILEGVPLMPKFTQEDGVEKKSRDFVKYVGGSQEQRLAFVDGYLEAKETYKYTEDDLRKALSDMYSLFMSSDLKSKMEVLKKESSISNKIIQSLQQPKRPKYFECKMDSVCRLMSSDRVEKEGWIKEKNTKTTYSKPKTITNSQGQTELIGEYIF